MLSQSGLDVYHSVQSEIRLYIQTVQSIGSQKVITQTLTLKKYWKSFFFSQTMIRGDVLPTKLTPDHR